MVFGRIIDPKAEVSESQGAPKSNWLSINLGHSHRKTEIGLLSRLSRSECVFIKWTRFENPDKGIKQAPVIYMVFI